MKLAIVGTGISGLICAHRLHRHHDVIVFEAADRIGGHANTVRVDLAEETHQVDTGFIVYNERNYPRFSALLAELGVATQPSEMSFSVRNERTGHEWSGSSLAGLFARHRDLASTSHWRMLAEILRFNRMARAHLAAAEGGDEVGPTLGELLEQHGFGGTVLDDYVVPLGSAIWSADPRTFHRYPARSLFRFLDNHGLISLGARPSWRTVTGGSSSYVERLVAPFRDRIRTSTPVETVVRRPEGDIEVVAAGGEPAVVDAVILACHSDEALGVLADPSPAEREVLGAIRYQPNVATLHTGADMLPRARRAWSSWNYHVTPDDRGLPTVTYWMNRLQSLASSEQICVTLNRHHEIRPDRVLGRYEYAHPVYDPVAVRAQRRRGEIQGARNTWFVGAYWGHGFHEDGVASADEVIAALARSPRRMARRP